MLESLHELKGKFYLVSYTASEQTYADAVLDFIQAQYQIKYPTGPRNLFCTRLYRQHCISTPYGCIKDLRVVENVLPQKMIIIDNSCLSYALNIDNGVPILPYYDNERDEELKHLTYYLNCLVDQCISDVRTHNREAFGLMKLCQSAQGAEIKIGNETAAAMELDVLALKSIDSDHDAAKQPKQVASVHHLSVNNQHLTSSEYLQCEPMEIKDFQHFDSTNQACEEDSNGGNRQGSAHTPGMGSRLSSLKSTI